MAEIIFSVILGLFVVLYLIAAVQLPDDPETLDTLGASGFPQIIGILALLVLLFLTFRAVREKKPVGLPLLNTAMPEGRLLLANVGLLGGYIVLLNILGFAVSTLLYLFIAPTSFGFCRWRLLAVFSLAGSVALVAMFGTVFYVPLPRGIGLFRELSYLLY